MSGTWVQSLVRELFVSCCRVQPERKKRNMTGATNASHNCKFSITLKSKVTTVKKKKSRNR